VAALWFALVAAMLALYVVFDGFDLGVGALHLAVARDATERRLALRSIGPVWDGNEVWLLAAGGTLFFAFPRLYASSLSGFYLPLMLVLWLLILRGVALELRHQIEGDVWVAFWDGVFALASALLALFYGAALGNVVRGVPLDAEGWFFVPLWTDLRPGPQPGVLDVYTLIVALAALAALVHHGALWLVLKAPGELERRARAAAARTFWVVVALTAAVTAASLAVQPQIARNLAQRPWGLGFPALALGGLAVARMAARRGRDRAAFGGSCAYLGGMFASAAFGVYPYVLPAVPGNPHGLTAQAAAAPPHALSLALVWWLPGMALVAASFAFAYRRFRGKVSLEGDAH